MSERDRSEQEFCILKDCYGEFWVCPVDKRSEAESYFAIFEHWVRGESEAGDDEPTQPDCIVSIKNDFWRITFKQWRIANSPESAPPQSGSSPA